MISPSRIRPAGAEPEPASTLNEPVAHLLACHRRIEERLATLERAGEHLETRPEEARAAVEKALHFLDTNGVMHTEDEEESAFPRLRPLLTAEEAAYLDELTGQHREIEEEYARLKECAAELRSGAGAAGRYRELASRVAEMYRTHIAYEESKLGGLLKTRLAAEQMGEIGSEMRRRRGL